jgi:integrase
MGAAATLEFRNLIFSSGERFPALLDGATGIPDFDATLYVLTQLRARNLSASTLTSAARAIMFGYQVLELIGVDLNERLANGQIFGLGEIDRLVDHFFKTQEQLRDKLDKQMQTVLHKKASSLESIRKSAPKVDDSLVSADTAAMRLLYFRDFIKWKVQGRLLSLSHSDATHITMQQAMDFAMNAINARMPKGSARSDLDAPQGLSDTEIKHLLEVIELDSPLNPWKSEPIRVRNCLIVQMLLNLGLRKGELLGLKVSDINFRTNELTIHRRADDVEDPRRVQPNAKTSARVLALDAELTRGLHRYLVKYRGETRNAKFHALLFVANGSGDPLSISAADRIFIDIKDAFPSMFDRLSPHLLRHTWNDKFSDLMDEAGIDEGKEQEARSYAMGWKPGSGTAKTYTRRHVRRKAAEASLRLQAKLSALKLKR